VLCTVKEEGMKRAFRLVAGVVLLLCFVSSAFAWEFSMKGEFEYRYRYFSRMGDKDLFGNLNFQDKTGPNSGNAIGFAGPAWYELGADRPIANANAEFAVGFAPNFITRGGFSRYGCDARVTDMKLTLYPSIKVNSAIEIFLTLNVGGFRNKYAMWRNDGSYVTAYDPATGGYVLTANYSSGVAPFERYYMSQSSDAATNTASIIGVDEFKFAVLVPWGYLSFGTKNFPIGTGATFARNTREESIYMAVPYGPFLLRAYLFPTEPPRLTGYGASSPGTSDEGFALDKLSGWGTGPDGELVSKRYVGGIIEYLSGAVNVGMGAFNRKQHLPRGYVNRLIPAFGTVTDSPRFTLDRETWLGIAWFKFNNGRFFFNAEGALADSETTISNLDAAYPTDQWPKYESLANHFFAEAGVFSGPSKLSLMYAQSSGRVLSSTVYPAAVPFAYYQTRPNPTKWYNIFAINYQALEPYNLLIFNTYGGGNGIVNPDGTGEMGDARAFAARLDYAVAANLNVFGSFMYAKRLERHGYYAGTFGTRDRLLTTGTGGNLYPSLLNGAPGRYTATAWKGQNIFGAFGAGAGLSPFVNDDLIGWEADAGFAWQLLEGFTWEVRYAYWKVGPWFDYAYKTFNGGQGTPAGSTYTGNDLMIGRSPIQAVTASVKVNF
jgi:hypothetical protein